MIAKGIYPKSILSKSKGLFSRPIRRLSAWLVNHNRARNLHWYCVVGTCSVKKDNIEVGLSVTSADDVVRQLFELSAPSINGRIKALKELHIAGNSTYTSIAPIASGGRRAYRRTQREGGLRTG